MKKSILLLLFSIAGFAQTNAFKPTKVGATGSTTNDAAIYVVVQDPSTNGEYQRTLKTNFMLNNGQDIGTWQSITATTKTLVAGEGYLSTSTSGSQLVYTLPTTASVGQVFAVTGSGAGGWRISQNSGQFIRIAGNVTTTGTAGYLTSGSIGNTVFLICKTANTEFQAITVVGSPVGN